jgi:SNF2 family DNA or RNA helicase
LKNILHLTRLTGLNLLDLKGLGKTIQGIASMSIYHEEWPVLVLCPSGARYHWQNEFVNWLGEQKQPVFKLPTGSTDEDGDESRDVNDIGSFPQEKWQPCMEPLIQRQVHVLTSGKEIVIPDRDTMVVICSYGLAPSMIKNKRIFPGQFKCAIVDESHMLKNKKSQRTQQLLPVLQATSRCVLLSGTPAFARPIELWPQLVILGTKKNGWDIQEDEFIQKYVKGGNKQRRAELHTMLTGTIMIRRMKNDILKSLPAKVREQAIVGVINEAQRKEFQQCVEILREGKGALGKIALGIPNFDERDQAPVETDSSAVAAVPSSLLITPEDQATSDMQHMYHEGTTLIHEALAGQSCEIDSTSIQSILAEQDQNLQQQCRAYYAERLEQLRAESAAAPAQPKVPSRKSVLMHMFKMTGQVKIPLIVEMLKKWIDDPAKGKLCLFAHHISVLNEIEKLTGLSNAVDSNSHFIRIDGSTGAKLRQEQINSFQKDPKVRVALLGITAAGVAVTLTASSTVWFAELFWTPALMIQAEDR